MERVQQFLDPRVKKVQSNGVVRNPARRYPLPDAATSSRTTDKASASLTGLRELVRDMRAIPAGHVRFMTVPRTGYRADAPPGRLPHPAADQLFRAPGGPDGFGNSGRTPSPNASDTASSGEKTASSPAPPTPSWPPIPEPPQRAGSANKNAAKVLPTTRMDWADCPVVGKWNLSRAAFHAELGG
ncbi:hypothetical protein [Streptomyces sp. NPDC014733]|uniref:hypothetical protein n=1 Tax=Streptomyces sp. NPDC014733 TaxID=3364885 RepID=UPI0036FF1049